MLHLLSGSQAVTCRGDGCRGVGLPSPESHPNLPRVGANHRLLDHAIPQHHPSPIPSQTAKSLRTCTIQSNRQEYAIKRRAPSFHSMNISSAAPSPDAEMRINSFSPAHSDPTQNPTPGILSGPNSRSNTRTGHIDSNILSPCSLTAQQHSTTGRHSFAKQQHIGSYRLPTAAHQIHRILPGRCRSIIFSKT